MAFLKQFAVLMAGLPNPIEREVYLSKVCRELEVDKTAVAGQITREQYRRGAKERKKAERELIAPPPRQGGLNREDELLLRQHPREMKAEERLLRYLLRHPDRAESLRERLPEERMLSESDREIYRVLLERCRTGQSLELTALGEQLPPQAVDRMTGWLLPGCLRCLNDYAARMSREQLGQLSGEELRRYIEALNRQKNKQGD